MQRIQAQLDRGVSLDTIVQQLAAGLATQVAAQLGISSHDASERLTQAFTKALAANGQGPPLKTNAERAAALATRFGRLADIAAGVTNGDSGPSILSIAGRSLDADKAGADTTPTPNTPAASPPVALVNSTDPAISGPSDGRSVALAPAQAIASGGDTLLGRIFARAWLAGDHANPAPSPATRSIAPVQRSAAPDAPAPDAKPATRELLGGGAQSAVDAFLTAFTSALAHDDAGHDPNHGAEQPAVTVPVAATNASTPAQGAVPFAILAHDAVSSVSPNAPAPTPQQSPQVDPQAVIEQMLRAMSVHTADGASTVRLRLLPEHLGDVSVKLVVSGGSVDATLTAHTADAQSALAGGASQLAKTLSDAGLKLQSFTVGLAGGGSANTNEQSNRHRSDAQSSVRRISGVSGDEAAEGDDLGLLAVPSFGPPVYTPSGSLGALNYLV